MVGPGQRLPVPVQLLPCTVLGLYEDQPGSELPEIGGPFFAQGAGQAGLRPITPVVHRSLLPLESRMAVSPSIGSEAEPGTPQ
jgi:hypothetical protein